MNEKINKLLTGAIGTAGVQATATIADYTNATAPSAEDIAHASQIAIQILIGVITLIQLLRKKAPKK
tara:strand:+ start:6849 stop:7049 length:201 start_codon:yes stop_codon:yes gene_type:complete